jgi:hypothetical protein
LWPRVVRLLLSRLQARTSEIRQHIIHVHENKQLTFAGFEPSPFRLMFGTKRLPQSLLNASLARRAADLTGPQGQQLGHKHHARLKRITPTGIEAELAKLRLHLNGVHLWHPALVCQALQACAKRVDKAKPPITHSKSIPPTLAKNFRVPAKQLLA